MPVYFILTLCTSVIGAISGIGGGVLMKPVLDLLSPMNAASINFVSSSAVFAMAAVSLIKSRKEKQKIKIRESSILVLGSTLGGVAGKSLFQVLIALLSEENAKLLQSTLLSFVTFAVFLYFSVYSRTTFSLKNFWAIFSVGFLLGSVSVFLGIGGGPLNLAALSFFFSMPPKQTALNSIYIIFFSQLASFFTYAAQGSFPLVPGPIIIFMISGSIVGGYLGTFLRLRMSDVTAQKLFKLILLCILALNLYNAFHFATLTTHF